MLANIFSFFLLLICFRQLPLQSECIISYSCFKQEKKKKKKVAVDERRYKERPQVKEKYQVNEQKEKIEIGRKYSYI